MKILILSIALVLTFYLPQKATAQVNVQDSLALIALYNSTDGPNWLTPWDTTQPVSTWMGVTVVQGRVTVINEYNNNLTGTLPFEIGNLDSLNSLYLQQNHLYGSIPAEIGNLINLHTLDLSNNQFSDSIPTAIGNLIHLFDLDLSYNLISGAIPNTIGNLFQLKYLNLNDNTFTHIPSSFSQLGLIGLSLNRNPCLDSLPVNMFNNVFYDTTQVFGIYISDCNLKNLPNPFPPYIFATDLDSNNLTFGDIEPVLLADPHQYSMFNVSPQDSVLTQIDTTIHTGDGIILNAYSDGQYNNYIWRKDGIVVNPYYNPTFTITNATISDEGVYTCEISNSIVTQLTLYRRPITLHVDTATSINITSKLYNVSVNYNRNTGNLSVWGNSNMDEILIFDIMGRLFLKLHNVPMPFECKLPPGGSYISHIIIQGKVTVQKLF